MANEKLVNRENLKAFRQKYDERLETGQVIPSKSLVAKELETVSPESGDTQETPFVLQGTGTANGTSSVDTGTVGKHIQKQGSVYCVNHLVQNGNFADSSGWNGIRTTLSASSNVLTATCNSDSSTAWGFIGTNMDIKKNHKYLVIFDIYHNIDLSKVSQFDITIGQQYTFTAQKNTWTKIIKIITPPANYTTGSQIVVRYTNTSDIQVGTDYLQCKNVQLIDLTQWFNGNIPQDLLDHPEHWSWYQTYGDYIAYNTGTLVSGNGRYLVCGGRNVWDEQIEGGSFGTYGQTTSAGQSCRSKNYIQVSPNTTYIFYTKQNLVSGDYFTLVQYDKNKNFISYYTDANTTFTKKLESNTHYIKIAVRKGGSGWGTNPPSSDVLQTTISLYYAGEDYSQYYPYEQPKVYDTGTETLLSTGVKLSVSGERQDVYDYKEPSGLITRRVGRVRLKDLAFTRNTSQTNAYFVVVLSDLKVNTNNSFIALYNKISNRLGTNFGEQANNKDYCFSTQSASLFIRDDSYSTANAFIEHFTDNDYLYYELATPTTEQGTPFSENIEINDFGTMGWYSAYTDSNTNELVNVPQGCKIFYPAWYVGFIDTLGQREDIDWDANNVVSQSELGVVDTKHDSLYAIMQENIGGALRHQLADKASIDFANTKFIDLGDYTFIANSSYQNVYYVTISDIKNASSNSSPANILCPLYKTSYINSLANGSVDNAIAVTTSGNYFWIRDTSVGNADNLNKKLKGILLAYEKAS